MPDPTPLPVQQPQPEEPQIRPGISVDLDLGKLLEEVERPDLDGRMQAVASSMIVAAGYNLKTGEMAVEFVSGRIYTYTGVPVDTFDGLMQAGSKGTFMRSAVIGQFSFL